MLGDVGLVPEFGDPIGSIPTKQAAASIPAAALLARATPCTLPIPPM